MESASPVSIMESCQPAAARGSVALPLPQPGWGVAQALLAVEAARPLLPALTARLEVVSVLSTVVLRADGHAVKVYPPGTDPDHLDRLRGALEGVPSILNWSAPPLETAYGVVTLMPWGASTGPLGWPALGALLRAFHDETTHTLVPRWTPLSRLPGQLTDLPAEQAAVLLGARAELLTALDATTSELGMGVLHGDVSVQNALRTDAGPRLIDPDWVAHGPREYDLASAARRRARGEIDRATYRRFCAAYGHDVRGWPGLPVLDRIAELGALAFRLWDCRRRGADLAWWERELHEWRVAI